MANRIEAVPTADQLLFDVHPSDRVQVFIDGQNLFGALSVIGKKIDYKKFIEALRDETRLIRANYYTTVRPKQQDDKQFRAVLDFLTGVGYSVTEKNLRETMDSRGYVRTRGSVHVEMAVDLINAVHNDCHHVILMSGDGELTAAVAAVKSLGIRVTVVASDLSLSDDLRRIADEYIDLRTFPSDILVENGRDFRPESQAA